MGFRSFLTRVCAPVCALLAAACGSSSETSTAPSQIRCAVEVRSDSIAFSADGGGGSARITANRECDWSAQSDASWLALTPPTIGQGDGTVTFRVTANGDPTPRAGGIVVQEQRLQISQAGRPCAFSLSSAVEVFGSGGGERTVQITASSGQCRWTAFSDAGWIAIASAHEGSGNGAVTFSVQALAGAPRSGSVTIGGNVLRVEQSTAPNPNPTPGPTPGCTYAIGATPALGFDSGGGARDLPITTQPGCNWSASTSVDWIAIAGQSGSGPGSVRITIGVNSGPPRNGIVRVADQSVTISQESGCSVTLNPTTIAASAAAGGGIIQVSAGSGCAWSASSTAAWIAITDGTGAGNGQVRFSIAANSGPERSGAIAIAGRTVAVAQVSGCTYSIAPTAQDVGGAGGGGAASVTTGAGCPWTAASGVEWIGLSSRAGSGPAQVAFTVSPNPGPPRSGTFTVAGHVFTVNQASPCVWALVPPSHHYDAGGGAGAILVIVTGSCVWTAASDVNWITVTAGTSGSGNGLVQFFVAVNTGPARTGSMTIAGQRYEVTQSGR